MLIVLKSGSLKGLSRPVIGLLYLLPVIQLRNSRAEIFSENTIALMLLPIFCEIH
jgi:hypothetical protein